MRAAVGVFAPLAATLLLVPAPALAQAPARLSDAQVEATLKEVDEGLGRFVDKMNPQVRSAIIRSERGEVDIKAFLKDLRKAGDAARSRFDPPRYAADSEVLAFLTQARRLDDGIGRRPGMSGADPMWELVKPGLARLGAAYGVDWTTDAAGWKATRTSDAELKAALRSVEKNADGVRKELDKALKKDKSLDAAARAKAMAPAVTLSTEAKQAASAFSGGDDISPLIGRLLGSAGQVEALIAARKPATTAWPALSGDLDTVARAYGVGRH
jgi:hypothetical protein